MDMGGLAEKTRGCGFGGCWGRAWGCEGVSAGGVVALEEPPASKQGSGAWGQSDIALPLLETLLSKATKGLWLMRPFTWPASVGSENIPAVGDGGAKGLAAGLGAGGSGAGVDLGSGESGWRVW